jgi:hypothetical protein
VSALHYRIALSLIFQLVRAALVPYARFMKYVIINRRTKKVLIYVASKWVLKAALADLGPRYKGIPA